MRRNIKEHKREEQDPRGVRGSGIGSPGQEGHSLVWEKMAVAANVKPGKRGLHWLLSSRACCSFFFTVSATTVIETITASLWSRGRQLDLKHTAVTQVGGGGGKALASKHAEP